jgi:hypothetical protein
VRNLSEFLSSWRVPRGKLIESTRRSNADKFRTGGEWKSSAKALFASKWAAWHNEVPDDLRRRLCLLMQNGAADLAGCRALERHSASRQLVQHGFERKQVYLSVKCFRGPDYDHDGCYHVLPKGNWLEIGAVSGRIPYGKANPLLPCRIERYLEVLGSKRGGIFQVDNLPVNLAPVTPN